MPPGIAYVAASGGVALTQVRPGRRSHSNSGRQLARVLEGGWLWLLEPGEELNGGSKSPRAVAWEPLVQCLAGGHPLAAGRGVAGGPC